MQRFHADLKRGGVGLGGGFDAFVQIELWIWSDIVVLSYPSRKAIRRVNVITHQNTRERQDMREQPARQDPQ